MSKGVTERFSDAVSRLQNTGDYVTVVRGVPRSLVMRCPDGCGETITVNLDKRTGPAWRTYERSGGLTIYPSIWRESGCRAHFIVWRNKILWCGPGERQNRPPSANVLIEKVYRTLPAAAFAHYENVAEDLAEIPWDVYWTCKDLVTQGRAEEGKQGMFRQLPNNTTPKTGGFSAIA